jgi:tetratricopeptide (TPR) repeat protein
MRNGRNDLISCAILLLVVATGCGSGGGSPFTDRATEAHRSERIEALRKQVKEQPRDARVWQELGTELLRESGSLVRLNDQAIQEGAMFMWPKAERVLDEAIYSFQNALQIDSTNAQLFALAGHAYIAKFRWDPIVNDTLRVMKAVSLLECSTLFNPELVDAHIDLVLALTPSWRWEGDMRLSKAHFEKALSLRPDDGMVFYAQSVILEVEERYPEALSALRKALSLGMRDEVAYLESPSRYQRIGWHMWSRDDREVAQAGGFLRKILTAAPRIFHQIAIPLPEFFRTGVHRKADELGLRNPTFYLELSRQYERFGRPEKGFEFVIKNFELDSLSNGDYSYWEPWQFPDSIWIDRFLKRMPAGSYYGYITAARKYHNHRPPDSVAAQKLIQTAIRLQPTYGAAYVELGRYYSSRQNEPKLYEKALPLEYHEPISLILAANRLSVEGNFDLALRYYNRILDLDLAPRIVVMRLIAAAYEQKKDRQAAFRTYIEIDHICPNAILCSWWGHDLAALISNAYSDRGDYDKAIEVLKRSIGNQRWQKMVTSWESSGDPKTYVDIGELYSKKGDSKNAIAYYQQALGEDAEYAEAHFALGEEYAKEKMKDKAIESYRQAAKLGNTAAKKALQKLGAAEDVQEKR